MKLLLKTVVFLLVCAITAVMLPLQDVDGAGVGVNPGRLYLELKRGSAASAFLTVINTGDRLFSCHVYVEGEEQDCFEFTPAVFLLSPNETRQVEVKALSSAAGRGERVVEICVVSLDPSGELAVGAGVKVKTYLAVGEEGQLVIPPWVWALIAGVVAAAVVLLILFLRYRRRRASSII